MPPHSAPCCRSSVATSPLAYRSGVRPDYATFHILRVLSSDADTTVLPSGANLHALTLSLPIFLEISGNTYVMVVYASPPLSGERAQAQPLLYRICLRIMLTCGDKFTCAQGIA